jgi:CheY-like chemotaxis protein
METKPPIALKLLLADDDKDDRFFFRKALEQVPVVTHLTTVNDGERLMDYFAKNSKHLPDVLFLDLNMPRKNGVECLVEIKLNEKLKQIPVIVYSTALPDETANVLYRNGAHYYMHKCDFSELVVRINGVLALLAENPAQPGRDKFILS